MMEAGYRLDVRISTSLIPLSRKCGHAGRQAMELRTCLNMRANTYLNLDVRVCLATSRLAMSTSCRLNMGTSISLTSDALATQARGDPDDRGACEGLRGPVRDGQGMGPYARRQRSSCVRVCGLSMWIIGSG